MPSTGQINRWDEDLVRANRFVGKTIASFQLSEAGDDRHERLTLKFTDGTTLVVESRVTDKESFVILGAAGPDGAPIREKTVVIT